MRSAKPKVLHQLAGKPLLEHVLDAAKKIGAQRISVVYGHEGEQVRSAMDQRNCIWVEQEHRLGTGHAVLQAMPTIQDMDRVLVLFGDVPLVDPRTLILLIRASVGSNIGVLTAIADDSTGYGRIIRSAESGEILRIVEEKDADPQQLKIKEINTGILVADIGILDGWLRRLNNDNAQGEYYLPDVIAMAVADGYLVASARAGCIEEVTGVNDRVQLAKLERSFQKRIAEKLMMEGVTLADPARIDIRGTLEAGQDVNIDINLVTEGTVKLGSSVSIGPNCYIRDSIIGDGVEILAGSVVEGAEIGAGSRVGPFSRLRPQARVGAGVHVGNFVEIKKSNIGDGSKVNHLSYVGDTEIGSRVNIGAGTITCNYDGAYKHVTVIEDDAFVGSNSALVAPVKVGRAATIGAGSVITTDAPAGALTLARGRQVTVPGWKRPRKKERD